MPRIYIVGGAPRTGKSIIARRLMNSLSVPWVSTDAFRAVAQRMSPPEERAIKFPFGGFTSADQLNDMAIKQMLEWQITEGESLHLFLRSFIDYQLGVLDNYIIEGVHFLPEHVRQFLDSNEHNDIKAVFIVSTNIDEQLKSMRKNTSHFDWLTNASDETFLSVAKFVTEYGKWLKAECQKYQLPYVERKGLFEEENTEILTALMS